MRVEIGGEAVAGGDEALHIVFAHSVDLAEPETERETGVLFPLKFSFVMPAKAGIQ